jgi:ubiquinone/menaquinone biosynthesis C-methylase UbiE
MLIASLHDKFIKNRRACILQEKLGKLFPNRKTSVLDIGCGDGAVASHLMRSKPNLQITGIDPLVRTDTAIHVLEYDGQSIPFGARKFDFSLCVDVLHHANDPFLLLEEATRVAKHGIIIKDHKVRGLLANQTLKFMDNAHNRRYGVSLPYNYWTPSEWRVAFERLNLKPTKYESKLQLYPAWADWLFGRDLHFIGLFKRIH